MTDDALRDLVTKHDAMMAQFATSIERLATEQTKTNEEIKDILNNLKEITSFLAKQQVFSNKLESMERELIDSFKRVHVRIDEIDNLQKSENGCNSVRLLDRDVRSVHRDTTRLLGSVEEHRMKIEDLETFKATSMSSTTIRWVIGIAIAYSVMFGTYVVQSINALTNTDVKLISLLERDIEDTDKLMALVYEGKILSEKKK